MITKSQLAALAASVNAEALAETVGISTKTVYRIRQQKANPGLDTVAAIEAAVPKLLSGAKRKRYTKVTTLISGA